MAAQLDHLIVRVNDAERSAAFYAEILGFERAGRIEPFEILRVNPGLIVQLAAWGTEGHEHFAFALEGPEFDAAFERIRGAGISYGDAFDSVGNNRGPGEESGARGPARTVYFMDPNEHLIEIRSYDPA
jgi:catechol 2,3-dioxygenase-like lactoylglutathione lyase family enzyme